MSRAGSSRGLSLKPGQDNLEPGFRPLMKIKARRNPKPLFNWGLKLFSCVFGNGNNQSQSKLFDSHVAHNPSRVQPKWHGAGESLDHDLKNVLD